MDFSYYIDKMGTQIKILAQMVFLNFEQTVPAKQPVLSPNLLQGIYFFFLCVFVVDLFLYPEPDFQTVILNLLCRYGRLC